MSAPTPEAADATDATVDIDAVVYAIDSLPIVEQLEFAHNLLLGRGGDRHAEPMDPQLVTATEVVRSVIGVLRKNPQVAVLNNN